jgi:hypothetical protein
MKMQRGFNLPEIIILVVFLLFIIFLFMRIVDSYHHAAQAQSPSATKLVHALSGQQ